MSRSVIVAEARTAIGKLSGQFASLTAQDLGGRHQGCARRTGVRPGDRGPRSHGSGHPRRPGSDPPLGQAAAKGRGPDGRTGDDDQQGLPLGLQDHLSAD